MSTYTLKLFNTGQVTLPKAWRDRFNTKNFLAMETNDDSLLIRPIRTEEKDKDVIYYETGDGCGLHFPNGIDPQILIDKIDEIHG